ncbi:phosphate ABC transporter permease PstA [Candidatus Bathyarchaeota archaeon]|nr:phosphate ABC transporter permease PstA [Candidatus Bathyarchaeota archaeon]
MKGKILKEKIFFNTFKIMTLIMVSIVVGLIVFIIGNSIPVLSLDFLFNPPQNGMMAGGISSAIAGTLILMMLTIIFSLPLGVGAAIFLSEYTDKVDPRIIRMIRLAINNLAGVPSIVYGLLGLGLFVLFLQLGFSVLSASLTLSFLTLPVIIAASEEALRNVPMEYREASLALGASKWETIKNVVLPSATPGILTACILGLSRAAGETAPLLMTGAAYYLPQVTGNIFKQFMALSTHIFFMATQSPNPEATRPIQFGTVTVLLFIVLSMNMFAIILRSRYRRRFK